MCDKTKLPVVNELPYNKTLLSNFSKKNQLTILNLAKYLKPHVLWCSADRELIINGEIVDCANLQSILRTFVHRDYKQQPPTGFDQFLFTLICMQNYPPMLCGYGDERYRDDLICCLARGGPGSEQSMASILKSLYVTQKIYDRDQVKQKLSLLSDRLSCYRCFNPYLDDLITIYFKYAGSIPFSSNNI